MAPVERAIAHEGEGDPAKLIGRRESDRLERLGLHELRCPCPGSILMGPSVKEDSVGADDQQLSEIAIPHFRYAARRSLPRDEFCLGAIPGNAAKSRGPEKAPISWTLAAIAEAVVGPIPGTLMRRRAVSSRLGEPHGAVTCGDLIVERLQLTDNRREGVPHAKAEWNYRPPKIAVANA